MGKYHIRKFECLGAGVTSFSPMDVDNIEDFITYLKNENAKTISLRYMAIYDDTLRFHVNELLVTDINQEHFDWLIRKYEHETRSFEIVKRF